MGFTMKTLRMAIATVSLIALAGCGSSTSSDTTIASTPADADVASFNDDDAMFAQMMIPHHEQAIEMADMALDPTVGANSAIVALATQIKGAQDPEIAQMTSFLTTWGRPLVPDDDDMDHSTMMSGMLSLEDLETLRSLKGAAFDKAWTEGMIAHHEGAIDMAEDVLKDGVNPEARTLAQGIIDGQTAEITTLRNLLK